MPVVDAVALFVTLNARFPSYVVMSNWARDGDRSLSLGSRPSGRWWTAVLDDVAALLRERATAGPRCTSEGGTTGKGRCAFLRAAGRTR